MSKSRDSTVARLIRMVEEAQAEKANTQRFLERAEQYYALGVIGHEGSTVLVCLNGLRLLRTRG